MGRYYGSEALRNPKLQKKAIDYALDKLNPMIQNVGSQALDQLSTKIRPNRKYKTNRKDLDGAGVDIHKLIGKIPRPKLDGLLENISTWEHTILSINS